MQKGAVLIKFMFTPTEVKEKNNVFIHSLLRLILTSIIVGIGVLVYTFGFSPFLQALGLIMIIVFVLNFILITLGSLKNVIQ